MTDRDRLVLEFLAEHRVGLEPQVCVLLGVSPRTARARLRALADGGYLDQQAIFEGLPPACRITRKGLGAIGSRYSPPRLDLACYQHDVGLGWLWLASRDGCFGRLDALNSERELRSRDARADPGEDPAGVRLPGETGPRGGRLVHYPDLVLHTASGHRLAVELELTAKSARRLDKVMFGYACDRRFDAVLYLVPTQALGERIERAARHLGITDRVHVQLTSGVPDGAPDHRRTVARRAPGRSRSGGGRTRPPRAKEAGR